MWQYLLQGNKHQSETKPQAFESISPLRMWQFLYGDVYQSTRVEQHQYTKHVVVLYGDTYQSETEAQAACGSHWCRVWE